MLKPLIRTIVFTTLCLLAFDFHGTPFDMILLSGSAHASNNEGTSPAKVPKAVFPETKFEFKSVVEGTDITHEFVIENQGQAPLSIEQVQPD